MSDRPVRIGLRENSRNDAHTRVSVFVGRNKGARGHAGEIVFRTDEWEEVKDQILSRVSDRVDYIEPVGNPEDWL